jgi:prepilin-type N-terminal cleavage/methylation domain-containing protein
VIQGIYHKMKLNQYGFSLLEILVALVLVSILSVLAVNRYTSRTDAARIAAAQSEEKSIAEAEQQCEIDTGYYVNLRALSSGPGTGFYSQGSVYFYNIQTLGTLGPFAIDTDGSMFLGNYFPYNNWNGPYMTYQSAQIDTTGTYNSGAISSQLTYGAPLDPWGHAYRLITPLVLTDPGLINGAIETNYNGVFYRNAIVSYGKDGVPGEYSPTSPNGTYPGDPNSDDIVYYFN